MRKNKKKYRWWHHCRVWLQVLLTLLTTCNHSQQWHWLWPNATLHENGPNQFHAVRQCCMDFKFAIKRALLWDIADKHQSPRKFSYRYRERRNTGSSLIGMVNVWLTHSPCHSSCLRDSPCYLLCCTPWFTCCHSNISLKDLLLCRTLRLFALFMCFSGFQMEVYTLIINKGRISR